MNKKVPLKIRKLMKEFKDGLSQIYGEQLKAVYLLVKQLTQSKARNFC